jgi:hypothetical protein
MLSLALLVVAALLGVLIAPRRRRARRAVYYVPAQRPAVDSRAAHDVVHKAE